MNSVLILVFNILTSSQAEPQPDPDTHIHVHLPPEESKGQSLKTGGGFLTSNSGQRKKTRKGQSPKTGGGNIISESEAGTAPTPTTPASTNNKDYADESACTIINGKQVCTGFSVTCGGHRALSCYRCPDKAPTRNARSSYCNGQCEWGFKVLPSSGECFPKGGAPIKSVSCGGHREANCALCANPLRGKVAGQVNRPYPERCHGDCRWGCTQVDAPCQRPTCIPKYEAISSKAVGFNGETLVENALSQYGDYWQPKDNKWPPKDNKWPTKKNKWPPKDNKWPARDNKWPAKDNKWPAKDNKWPAKDNKWPVKDNKWPAKDNKWPAKDSKWSAKDNKWPAKDNKWPAKDNKWSAKDNKWPAKDNKWHPQENGRDYKDSKWPAKDNKWHAKDNKWPAKDNKWPAKDSKWPAKDSKWPAKDSKWPAKDKKWSPQENGRDYSLLSALSSLLHHAPHHPPPPPPNWTPKPVTSWRKRQKK